MLMRLNGTLKTLLLSLFISTGLWTHAQISLTSFTTPYTENFNTLAQSGASNVWTDNSTIAGWYTNRTIYIGDAGSSTTGALYSYGSASNSDRALGALTSGTTGTVNEGVRLVNNTGVALSGLTISFKGEQWRQTANTQKLVFDYQVGATSLTSGTWTTNTAFDFTTLKTGTAGALDGNASGDFSNISGTLTVSVANGQEIWLRWTKTGTTSPGLALDDISITPIVATPTTSSITPASTSAGGGDFTLTVNGTNFVNGSTVTWNGSSRTTTFVSSSQLTATILAADIATAGTATVGVTTSSAPAVSNTQTFTIGGAAQPALAQTALLSDFGNVCTNTTSQNSFTLDGSNLDGTNITIDALSGFAYSETANGTYTTTLSFSYTGNSFTGKQIYVQFTPTAVQSYNGNINVSGGGATAISVAATGSGVFTAPTVTTGTSSSIAPTSATVSGSINAAGCSTVTAYGIEYSTSSGFPSGTGTQIAASNLSSGNYSVSLSGLAPNTRYYYKAYATSAAGTSYGVQGAFNAATLPVPMASQTNMTYTEDFSDIANWSNFFITGTGANHFTGLSTNATGTIPDGVKLTTSTQIFVSSTSLVSGGVQKGTDQTPATTSIVLLSTGSTDNTSAVAIDFYMDFTGVNAGTLSFDWASINNSTGDRKGSLHVYATTDGVTFTDLSFADVLNFTNNAATSGSKQNIALPSSFNNSATARLRFYYSNGTGGTTGSRPKISIDNLVVTAVATTPCSSPTAPATNLVFGTTSDVAISGSFTAASPATDNYLVVVSTNSALTGNPVDGQNYSIGDNLGDGTVIYKGSGTSFTATGLNASTTYYFFVFPLNSICTGGPLYYTTTILSGQATTNAGLPACAAPASQPSALILSATGPTGLQGSFTGNSSDKYLVVYSTSATLGATPVDGHVYSTGEVLGNGTVVQNSASTTFTLSSLSPSTTYYVYVFAISDQNCTGGPVFNSVSPLNGNVTTQALPACSAPTGQPTTLTLNASTSFVTGAFASGTNADSYLIIRSSSSTLSADPVNATTYTAGDNVGGGTVVGYTTGNSFIASGLTSGSTYYFFIYATNKTCSGGPLYLITSPLVNSVSTQSAITNNYYFGTLHSHSAYSDGNKDSSTTNYKTPADDYDFARTAQCMDYLGISEHNHFSSVNNPGNTMGDFHQGPGQADTYTASHTNFLALYGMEWGVISNGGHVVIYGDGMNNLWGWESGSGSWGSTDNYDAYVAKSDYTGSSGLFKTVNDNIGTNTFATLAHPNTTDYNSLATVAYNSVADQAIVGAAVESGPANSTNTSYSDPGSSMSYLSYFQKMLALGYHLAPTIDHDNHYTTFGKATHSRTAIIASALTKTQIISAMRNMHFYATQDCDTKVDFSINTNMMGSIVTDRYAPVISATLTDATTSLSSAVIRLMYGVPGSGATATKIDSTIGSSYTYIDNSLANLSTGYYYLDIVNGSARIITAPIWYTRSDNSAVVLPVKIVSFSAAKSANHSKLTWSVSEEVNAKQYEVERSLNGRDYQRIGMVNAVGNISSLATYQFFDNQNAPGTNYYRLKLVDNDGKYEYSRTVKLSFDQLYTVNVAPNPTTGLFSVSISGVDKPVQMQIVDLNGKVLRTQFVTGQSFVHADFLSRGMYLLRFSYGDAVVTEKLTVE
jgi:hypothetical protein